MGKALIKSLLFLLLVLGCSKILVQPFLFHPFWGDVSFICKYDHFFSQQNNYNTVFIGSSRTYRHVNPSVFDSITGLNSFNFGITGVGCPYNYWLTDKVLDSENLNIDFLFLELFSPENNLTIDSKKDILHTDKVLYWYGIREFCTSIQSVCESPQIDISANIRELRVHTINLIESSFHFGFINRLVNASKKTQNDENLGLYGNGFYNGQEELASSSSDKKHLQERVTYLQQHPEEIESRAMANGFIASSGIDVELAHWSYIQDLKEKCDNLGVNLVLVLQPLQTDEQAKYMALLKKNKPDNLTLIDLSNSKQNPEFYQSDVLFDTGHLNQKGATLLSIALAEKTNQLILP